MFTSSLKKTLTNLLLLKIFLSNLKKTKSEAVTMVGLKHEQPQQRQNQAEATHLLTPRK